MHKRCTWDYRGVLLVLLLTAVCAPTDAGARQQDNERRDAWLRQQVVRGSTRLYLEDYVGAERIFEDALKIVPDDATLMASLAQAKAGQEDFASAAFFLGRALDAEPENVSLWRLAASLREQAGDPTGLLDAYRTIANLDPEDARVRLDEIELLIRLEAFSEALAVVDGALQAFEPGLQFLRLRADLLEKLGRMNAYEETLRRIVASDPADSDSMMRLAASLVRSDRQDRAEAVLRDLLRIDPGSDEAAQALADLLQDQGRSAEADELLAELRTDDSSRAEPIAPDLTSGTESIASLKSRLANHPGDVSDMRNLAVALRASDGFLEAAELFERITSLEPRDLDSWLSGIECYLDAEAPNRALELANAGLSLFPGYVPLVLLRTRSLIDAGRTEEALEEARALQNRTLEPEQRSKLEGLLRRLEAM
jgi:tetratricopeptide (TPR) repeat protein